jgi:hypothetical protein
MAPASRVFHGSSGVVNGSLAGYYVTYYAGVLKKARALNLMSPTAKTPP